MLVIITGIKFLIGSELADWSLERSGQIRSVGNSLFSGQYYTRKYGISGADYLCWSSDRWRSVLIKASSYRRMPLISCLLHRLSTASTLIFYHLLHCTIDADGPRILPPRVKFLVRLS